MSEKSSATATGLGEVATRASWLGGPTALHIIVFLSGTAGLAYQIVWVRMLTVGLGHEVFSLLAILAAFFSGLAIGAWLFDRRVAASARPGLWYVCLELIIGGWALALIWLVPLANQTLSTAMGPSPSELWRWLVAFSGTTALLLPATVAMGATLPAAERLLSCRTGRTTGVGGLYAANTAGAVLGVLATTIWIVPSAGYTTTLICFAFVNLLCAAWTFAGPGSGEVSPKAQARLAKVDTQTISPHLMLTVFLTGLLGIGFEVAGVRALAQLLENTVYSFAAALTVYLLGTAMGAAAWQIWGKVAPWSERPLGLLIPASALAGLVGVLAIFLVRETYEGVHSATGFSFAGALIAELACAALVFGPTSVATGALFAHLAQAARRPAGGLGLAFASNLAGSAVAPVLVGVLVIPTVGVIAAMAGISLGYLLLLALWRGAWSGTVQGLGVAMIAMFAMTVIAGPVDHRLVSAPPGSSVVTYREGVAANVNIIRDAAGDLHLRVNGTLVMGGTASYALDRTQGHAILLQHPKPRRALFLGVGTGATVAAAAAYEDLHVDAVELLPEVLDLVPAFEEADRDIRASDGRIELGVADARRFVNVTPNTYDVIIADNFHPAKDGVGLLYTREHFRQVRNRLSDSGSFAQWLPLHQLDEPTLRLIIRSFLAEFPDARLQVGNFNLATPILALVGQAGGERPVLRSEWPSSPRLRAELRKIGLDGPLALYGGFLAGPDALAAYAGEGALNTDDLPLVVFEAPRTVYEPLDAPIDRLMALVERFSPSPRDAVDLSDSPDADLFAQSLVAYWRARDAFLRLGASTVLSGDVVRDARRLAPELLRILRMSPEFSPALRPLLNMAQSLAPVDPDAAKALLVAVNRTVPGQAAVQQLARQLFPN